MQIVLLIEILLESSVGVIPWAKVMEFSPNLLRPAFRRVWEEGKVTGTVKIPTDQRPFQLRAEVAEDGAIEGAIYVEEEVAMPIVGKNVR